MRGAVFLPLLLLLCCSKRAPVPAPELEHVSPSPQAQRGGREARDIVRGRAEAEAHADAQLVGEARLSSARVDVAAEPRPATLDEDAFREAAPAAALSHNDRGIVLSIDDGDLFLGATSAIGRVALERLRTIAESLRRNRPREAAILLVDHAERAGSARNRGALTAAREEAVRRVLVQNGVDAELLRGAQAPVVGLPPDPSTRHRFQLVIASTP